MTTTFWVKKLDTSISKCLGSQLNLSSVSFDLNGSFFFTNTKMIDFLKKNLLITIWIIFIFFWIVSFQGWTKTGPDFAFRPQKTLNCFECYRYSKFVFK